MAGPPIKARPHNLPSELTSFVGRRRELGEVKRLLAQTRLLTLTGSGGAGKTRLALRAAAEVARSFPDGVWLVSLATIDDPGLVVQAVFSALGLQDISGSWSLSTLSQYLADKRLLLVLDNCEHLLDSCAVLAVTLLRSCPELRVLATSRQGLSTSGETRMRVPPLSLPEHDGALTAEQLATYEAVALLVERAAAVARGFKVDQANVSAVLRLCRRLDGMPLALELAAVRLEGLSVEQVVHGLESEPPILGTGDRGAEARQRTLDATIGWSYGLLDVRERRLWARLSAFTGGFDAAAATVVCSGGELPPDHIAEALASLVEKSIVQRDADQQPARYTMLETVRQYGRQRLRDSGEEVEIQRRHRDWILQLAKAVSDLECQLELFDRVRLELHNVWSALEFCRRQPGEEEAGIHIVRWLYPYWWSRGPLGDVRRILEGLYALTAEDSVARGWCALTTALLAGVQDDAAIAQSAVDESLRIGQLHGHAGLMAWASAAMFISSFEVHVQPQKGANELLRVAESVTTSAREADHWAGVVIGLSHVCKIQLSVGGLEAAVNAGEEALELCRSHGDVFLRGFILSDLSDALWRLGHRDRAEAIAREGAAGQHALGGRRALATLVETLAWMASERGASAQAATLLGCAHGLRESIMLALPANQEVRHRSSEDAARAQLGDAGYTRAFGRGAVMPDEEAIAYVLEQTPVPRRAASSPPPEGQPVNVLTRRELEIAHLIAEGLTSQQIAARLFISERTVTTHVTNMLNKLGLSSRIQLASWVAAAGERARDATRHP